jgi:hypothetical protein
MHCGVYVSNGRGEMAKIGYLSTFGVKTNSDHRFSRFVKYVFTRLPLTGQYGQSYTAYAAERA